MVLEKLGDSLKNTLGKIAKAVFVDDTLINELVKEIQRALIQSDTNIKLVLELTNKIKARAKEKNPPGPTKKEQLVNIVYEELTNFLGKETKEIQITKKPTQILLVGLFGSGKCVSPNTLIPLYNGEIKTIEEIYTEAQGKKISVSEKEGHRIEFDESLLLQSLDLDTLKTVPGKATSIWKLKAAGSLLKIYLDNGQDHFVEVTPEHPFFYPKKWRY
ncbi:MAG: signal recognition particle receptor subunit alpha [Candidatus Woesearchaeota archaeon]